MSSGAKQTASRRALLLGAGRMGGALAKGWRANMRAAGLKSLDIVDPKPTSETEKLAEARNIRLNAAPRPVDLVILAVKPQGFAAAAPGLAPWIGSTTLAISVMAGIRSDAIAERLGTRRVIRTMPNTPGAIGQGVTAYTAAKACSSEDRVLAETLLAPLGAVVGPMSETELESATAISGCGPAYLFLLAEVLEAAARSSGLKPEMAAALARQTITGAGALLAEGGEPGDLRRAVTSPGGVTAAALDVLMAPGAMPELFRRAVEAAIERNRQLAKPD